MRYRFLHCLLPFLVLCSCALLASDKSPANGHNNSANLSVTCPPAGPVDLDCLPPFPRIVRASETTSSDGIDMVYLNDLDYFENNLGGNVISSCNDIVVQVTDSAPDLNQNCLNPRTVTRTVTIYDGIPVNSTESVQCIIEYNVKVPKYLELGAFGLPEVIVDCSDDIPARFQDYLDSYLNAFDNPINTIGCTPLTLTPITSTVINYECGSEFSPGNGSVRPIFELIDSCGHGRTITATFRVVDNTPPIITCPKDSIFLLSKSDTADIRTYLVATAFDACNSATADVLDYPLIDIECMDQPYNITFIATDECGNPAECITNITVKNDTEPFIQLCSPTGAIFSCADLDIEEKFRTWKAMTRALEQEGSATTIPNDRITFNTSGGIFDESELLDMRCNDGYNITVIATNECGKSAMCMTSFSIQDTFPPELITCPPPLSVTTLNPTFKDEVLTWLGTYDAMDQCNPNLELRDDFDRSILDDNCSTATIPVIFTANDLCNDIDSTLCVSEVTIQNTVIAAFISLPSDTTIQCSTDPIILDLEPWYNQASAGNNAASPMTFTVLNDLPFVNPAYTSCDTTIEVIFSFFDQCGTEFKESVMLSITDTIPPTIMCPPKDTLVGLFQDLEADISAWRSSTIIEDNCLFPAVGATRSDYSDNMFTVPCGDTVTQTITFFARDLCEKESNCESDLTIITDKSPTLTCPPNLILDCGAAENDSLIMSWLREEPLGLGFLGDTIAASTNYNPAAIDFITCLDSLEVTFEVEYICDPSNQYSDACTSFLVVQDLSVPSITCPSTLNLKSTDSNNDQLIQDWLQTSIYDDNGCTPPDFDFDYVMGSIDYCEQSTTTNVVFTVTDVCGNNAASCVGLIALDISGPTLNCPTQGLELECGEVTNLLTINDWLPTIQGEDNTGTTLGVINDFDSGVIDTSCSQFIPVAFSIEDICEREATCIVNISIRDSNPPQYLTGDCPEPLDLLSGSEITDKQQIFEDWVLAVQTIDCNETFLTHDFDPTTFTKDCDDVVIDITFFLEDECGFKASNCQSEIRITNSIAPIINCPTNALPIECNHPDNEQIILDWLATATANDGILAVSVNNDYDENDPAFIQCSGTVDVTFLMTNFCGDNQDCMQRIIVEDTTDPAITCPDSTSIVLESPSFDMELSNWIATSRSMDNCISNLMITNDALSVLPVGSLPPCVLDEDYDITFDVEDGCGNSSSCIAILNISTVEASSITCPVSDLVLECGAIGNDDTIVDWLTSATGLEADGSAIDPSFSFRPSDVTDINCDGTVNIEFSIEDVCTNILTCMASIIVEDTTPPMSMCPSGIVVNSTDPDGISIAQDWLDEHTVDDGCSIATASMGAFVLPVDFCDFDEETIVEFYAEDVCGLRDTCRSTLSIIKDLPLINCLNDIQLQCGELNNDMLIADWLETMTGLNNNGVDILVSNNYNPIMLPVTCESDMIVTFMVEDQCGITASCQRSIIQRDTIAPVINTCPSDIEISVETPMTQLIESVDQWLGSYQATDLCNTAIVSNDYNLQIVAFDCGSEQDVQFTAVDECNNVNADCIANITFFNELEVEISCPENIVVKCNDAATSSQIEDFLNGFQAVSQDSFAVTNDFDITAVDTECSMSYSQEVLFTISDRCGNIDECSAFIDFIPTASIYIPDIFNPSLTGEDSFFSIRTNIAIETVTTFRVYSRWGDLMFERENFDPNLEKGWGGRDQYGNSYQGVYTYYINYNDIFGNPFEHIGTITLIK